MTPREVQIQFQRAMAPLQEAIQAVASTLERSTQALTILRDAVVALDGRVTNLEDRMHLLEGKRPASVENDV